MGSLWACGGLFICVLVPGVRLVGICLVFGGCFVVFDSHLFCLVQDEPVNMVLLWRAESAGKKIETTEKQNTPSGRLLPIGCKCTTTANHKIKWLPGLVFGVFALHRCCVV